MVTVVVGDEELLVERAVGEIVGEARRRGDDVEVVELTPGTLEPGKLVELTSPSLFGGGKVLVIRAAQDLGKDLAGEVGAYVKNPADDIVMVLVHAGGVKGKGLLEAWVKAGARKITCPKVTKAGERLDFLRSEVRRLGGSIGATAAQQLLDAVGTDLREIAAACNQLVSDTGGKITDAAVARYHRGRAEVSGFTVADAAVEGRLGEALEQLRWALSTGVAAVLINSALAQGVRGLAKVGGARGKSFALAKELGMPPWKIERLQKQVRGWSPDGIARALVVVAETDQAVKGGGADPGYALERAVHEIVAARSGRRG
ncbi:DNA polymerase III subunit delta [Actinocorallia sp. A-T 12471]|uniref:DNA polymerase III subunit delta n=1 Tax=Actinocorallia sp. A-T 12471 TaxID=3089813 RepID=UPI0029CB053D|nr:DNA polymerase III subunit delta [Actinocorallia sp. A-T 12471]MDX6743482.1 DNA polymerase III subunit delta [Actinocorallia sp. A-T 12471]